jgi:hypothetical protein
MNNFAGGIIEQISLCTYKQYILLIAIVKYNTIIYKNNVITILNE